MINNKTILIISPQEWNSIKVSKHHYAEELANCNNKVYYINPIKSGIKFFSVKLQNNIYIVNIYLPLPYAVKFKIPIIYHFFLNFFTFLFLKLYKIKPDIIWDFDNTHQYNSYNVFKSKLKIYHPVDATMNNKIEVTNKKPDIMFSVSPLILKKQQFNCPKYLINHGLSQNFIKQAQINLLNYNTTNKIKSVGYSGNLNSHLIAVNIFEEVVKKYPNIKFFFIGPYNDDSKLFLILQKYSNCCFTGKLNEEELVKKLNEMDLLIYYYNPDNKVFFSDNSHKILEYLSTGKIILGNKLLAYENNNLIIQVQNEKDWLSLFNEIVMNTHRFMDELQYKLRIQFALENSYKNQLEKISNYLMQNNLL